ncbi:hypothetical protein K7X08_022915 [Anisodus acutangulus]|uniref:F-box associated beta-propeller type 1 domain-containing protein n=1 Tax=Anisodus acutangulus TaxID=402998 RepID=A0A9Q1MBN7_9SOLA|nr:hypothetical protein K7X08_022915 [Anisodus acutangulus]
MEEKSKESKYFPLDLPYLPQEIIFEILLRLPVKSLLKFRVAAVTSISGSDTICNFYNIVSDNSFVTENCPPKSLSLSGRILGSCNGLICLNSDSFTLTLLNPCTRKFNVFIDTAVQYKGSGIGCSVSYGFGYDASVEDYKVVKIFSFNQTEDRYENMVKVYSLKAKSWKIIQGFNSGYINGKVAIFANGTLHWEACLGDSWEIITYDLTLERIEKMVLPNYEGRRIYWTLGVSRGYLIACCNYEPNRADIWVMKEYGVEKSWTKLVTISSHVDRWAHISPLFAAENGDEVLLKIDGELKLYNSRNGSFKRFKSFVSGDFCQVQVIAYFESLASPHI